MLDTQTICGVLYFLTCACFCMALVTAVEEFRKTAVGLFLLGVVMMICLGQFIKDSADQSEGQGNYVNYFLSAPQ